MRISTAAQTWWMNAGIGILCAFMVLPSTGCERVSQYLYLRRYDSEVQKASRAIESAQDDIQRAAAYTDRGAALGEKARYSRAFKLVPDNEYARLLDSALKDHAKAIELTPHNAEVYYQRGHTYYIQAAFSTFDLSHDPTSKANFESAKLDFTKAIELDPRHASAYEYRGMANEGTRNLDQAIANYTQLAALQPKSRYRLADAYCNRGSSYMRDRKYDPAIADLEKSIEIGSNADGCSCEPYNPLLAIYLFEAPNTAKARDVVRRAQAARKWIAPEYLKQINTPGNPQ
jgi:tetratricopeptide (TPR) repeat protein